MPVDASDAIFAQDLAAVAAIFMSDDTRQITEDQKHAAARVVTQVFMDLHGVATSLRRIADAQEAIAAAPYRQSLRNDPGW